MRQLLDACTGDAGSVEIQVLQTGEAWKLPDGGIADIGLGQIQLAERPECYGQARQTGVSQRRLGQIQILQVAGPAETLQAPSSNIRLSQG